MNTADRFVQMLQCQALRNIAWGVLNPNEKFEDRHKIIGPHFVIIVDRQDGYVDYKAYAFREEVPELSRTS